MAKLTNNGSRPRRVQLSIHLPKSLHIRLKKRVAEEQTTATAVVNGLVEEYLRARARGKTGR